LVLGIVLLIGAAGAWLLLTSAKPKPPELPVAVEPTPVATPVPPPVDDGEKVKLAEARGALIAQTLAGARESLEKKDWARSESLAQTVLSLDAGNADANRLLGAIEAGKKAEAEIPQPTPEPEVAAATPAPPPPAAVERTSQASPWLYPGASDRYLTRDQIDALDGETLWRVRNEIYVRHGYIFASEKGKNFAASYGSAYVPRISGEEAITQALNPYESANVDLIKEVEAGK
jgi:hypothetical protein